MTTTVEILKAARELIRDERHWIKGAFVLFVDDERFYCASGAINAVVNDSYYHGMKARNFLREVVGGTVCVWNDKDKRTHAEVLEAFDQAIKLAADEKETEHG